MNRCTGAFNAREREPPGAELLVPLAAQAAQRRAEGQEGAAAANEKPEQSQPVVQVLMNEVDAEAPSTHPYRNNAGQQGQDAGAYEKTEHQGQAAHHFGNFGESQAAAEDAACATFQKDETDAQPQKEPAPIQRL